MPHSHLLVAHLLRQIGDRPAPDLRRDTRPAWLTDFVERVSGLFEPVSGLGRVGFDCRPDDGRWCAAVFLGATEVVGGPQDGLLRAAGFSMDLVALQDLFDRVDDLSLYAAAEDGTGERPRITLHGEVAGEPVTLEILSAPPGGATPGFKRYAGGWEPRWDDAGGDGADDAGSAAAA